MALIIKIVGMLGVAVTLTDGILVAADQETCRGAVFIFKSTQSTVGDYLRRYVSCLSRNDGRSDCSIEFSRLRSAQEDFEKAVSDYQRECL
jgi:hypothetical protein